MKEKTIIMEKDLPMSIKVITDKDNIIYVEIDGVLKMLDWLKFTLLQMKESNKT